jgi:Peptidase family S41
MSQSPISTRRAFLGAAPCALLGASALPQARSASLGGAYEPRMLHAAEAKSDVVLLKRALEVIHPGLYRRRPRNVFESACAGVLGSLGGACSEIELYRQLSGLLAGIRCTHTKVDQSPALARWRQSNSWHMPFRFRLIDGRMIVASSTDNAVLARGTEVLKIGSLTAAELTASLGQYASVDGDTEWSRGTLLSHDGDLMGADFDHFFPYVHAMPALLQLWVRDSDDGAVRRVGLPPISFGEWLKLDPDDQPYRADFADSTSWRMLRQGVGYLRVDTFVNYRRPVDAQRVFTEAMGALAQSGATRLVVDLRHNGGGSDDAALALLDHLMLAPYVYQSAIRLKAIRYGDLADHIETWGDRDSVLQPPEEHFIRSAEGWYDLRPEQAPDLLNQRTPAPAAFRGQVVVLTSPVNASGATMVVSKLRDAGRVSLVGEPCGGSADGPTAGKIFNVRLPASGLSVRIPVAFNAMNVRAFDARGGIRPDKPIVRTVADFRQGIDRVLDSVG